MEEIPNLSYVREIAGEDNDFAQRFMSIFKEEFRWEVGMYLRLIKKERPREAAEIVAKSKYKLSMLGLNRAFALATNYEERLQYGDTRLDAEFRKILTIVNAFLAKTANL